MAIHWSPSTGAFYHVDIHGEAIPSDAVRISEKRHAALLAGRASGRAIVENARGKPELAFTPVATVSDFRSAAIAAVKREARRRILAIASLERQSNDNADIAMACLSGGPAVCADALARRAKIDAVRAASNVIEATLADSSAAAISTFNADEGSLWPAKDS